MKKLTIKDWNDKLVASIKSVIEEHTKQYPAAQVILGSDNSAAQIQIFKITKFIDLSNQIFDSWITLMPGKERTLNEFKELAKLMEVDPGDIPTKVRVIHAQKNKLVDSMRGFKIEKLVFAIDYSSEAEEAFEKISSLFSAWVNNFLPDYSLEQLWSDKVKGLALSNEVKERIIQKALVIANSNDLHFSASLSLIVTGLTGLGNAIDNPGMTTRDLTFGQNRLDSSSPMFKRLTRILSRKLISDSNNDFPKKSEFEIDYKAVLGVTHYPDDNPKAINIKLIEEVEAEQESFVG